MVATLVLELFCFIGIVFMIRFLIALFREGRTTSRCQVVHLTSRHLETEDDPSQWVAMAGAAFSRNDAKSRLGLKAIAGGRERPFRRVG